MLNLFLILSYLSCVSSNQMLSMLIFLVASYMSASVWFISNGIIYAGLLYILVYVGAIVVLIMFVVQLTNTSLSGDTNSNSINFIWIQNSILIVGISLLLLEGYTTTYDTQYMLDFSSLSLTDNILPSKSDVSTGFSNPLESNTNNLSFLANSIFNEYGYILIISVHAIVLAIIGPIKLATSSLN